MLELEDVPLRSCSILASSVDVDVPLLIPEPVPVLASEPIVELELVPVPIDVESGADVEDDVAVLARAGSAKAATTSDVQINFFMKPPCV